MRASEPERLTALDWWGPAVPLTARALAEAAQGHQARALAEALRGRVLYRDEELLVLDKPPGLAVQGGPGVDVSLDAALPLLRLGAASTPRRADRLHGTALVRVHVTLCTRRAAVLWHRR